MSSTSPRIALLDPQTINQIAAGEVVENSASIIKELVENALDAQATEILVETLGGGKSLIRVSDNGRGIHPEDLPLAVERHATSKLRQVEDLEQLLSLGFRGEALACIAAVSHVEITSATTQSGKGFLLETAGGAPPTLSPYPRTQGTTVQVKGVFFNVPARKKFQKSASSEEAEIRRVLVQFGLCYPEIQFVWKKEGETVLSLEKGENLPSRMEQLLGKEYALGMLPVELKEGELALSGAISAPFKHLPNRKGQSLFVNGRMISSPFLSKVILDGYGTRLPIHRYPLFVLHLTLPPSWVDPNVHPQKKEVRFRNEERLAAWILRGLEKILNPPAPPVSFPTPSFAWENEWVREEPFSAPYIVKEEALSFFIPPPCRVLALFKHYILLERGGEIRVVDSLRAIEHVWSETKGEKTTQQLLVPFTIDVSPEEALVLSASIERLLSEEGIGIRPFGGTTFLIESTPPFLERGEVEEFLHLFLDGKQKKRVVRKGVKTVEEAEHLTGALFALHQHDKTVEGKPIHCLLTEKMLLEGLS